MKAEIGNASFIRPFSAEFQVVLLVALLVASVFLLSGCGFFSNAPRASAEEGQRVKLMAAPEDRALVYVYRNAIWGRSLDFNLTANGQTVGESGALTYFVLEALPGKLTLTSEGTSGGFFNLIIGKRFWGFQKVTLELPVEAGKKYFVFQDVKQWEPNTGLRAVEEKEGWKSLSQCRLIKVVKIKLAALPKTSEVIPGEPASEMPAKPASEAPAQPTEKPAEETAEETAEEPQG